MLYFISRCRLIEDCGSVDAHNGEYIATWVNAGVLRVASGSVDGGLETVYTTPADTASLAISGETACIAYHPTAGAAGVIGEVQVDCAVDYGRGEWVSYGVAIEAATLIERLAPQLVITSRGQVMRTAVET